MHRLKVFEFRFSPTLMIALLLVSASPARAGWQWTELFAAHPVDREMRVTAMVEHQGSIFVAGYPLEIVSVGDPLDVLLQRHTDGTWSSVLTREDFYAYPSTSVQDVRCLLSTASGLVVGGTFDVLADSAGYSNIALYQQGQWSKLGLGLPRSPWVLAEHRGELYAGCYSRGTLSASVGYGTPSDSTRATLWRFDGVDWIPLPPIPGTRISLTRALLSRPEGLWVGGFYEADGGPYGTALLENGVWTLPGGGLQSTLPPTSVVPLHVLQGVTSLVDYQGSVYASGSFRSPAIQAVARYDAGGWSDLGVEGSVEVLHEHRGALVAIGNATFPRAAAAPRRGISRWDGVAWSDELGAGRVHPELGAMRSAVSVGDTLVLGGVQRGGYGIADNPQAFLMNDGSGWRDVLDSAGVTGIQFMGQVNALEVVGDSLIVGGRFLGAGGQPMRSVASVGTGGWSSMGQGLMSSAPCPTWGSVVDLLRVGGVQYAAGSFLARDPQTGDDVRTSVARLRGSTWEAVTAGLAPPDSMGRPAVRHLLTWRNRLTAVGEVRTLVNSSEFGIAVLVNDTWQPTIPALASAQLDSGKSISDAVVLGEDLIIGGSFDSVAGSNTGGLARFDGVTWSNVLTQPEAFGRIDLQVYGGVLYIAGRRAVDPTGPTLFRVVNGALEPLGAGSVIPYSVLVSTPHGLFAMGEGLVRIIGSTLVPQQISSWPNQFELSTGWYALTSAVYRPATDEIVIGGLFSANPPLWSNGLGALRFDASVAAIEIPRLQGVAGSTGLTLTWQWPDPWSPSGSVLRARLEQRTRDQSWQTRRLYEPPDFTSSAESWLVPRQLIDGPSEFRLVAETESGDLAGESLYLRSPRAPVRSQWLSSRPNPFNPSTVLEYSTAVAGIVDARVYSVGGRLVRQLEGSWQEPGIHELTWNGRDDGGRAVASGAYLVVLDTADGRDQMKIVLAK